MLSTVFDHVFGMLQRARISLNNFTDTCHSSSGACFKIRRQPHFFCTMFALKPLDRNIDFLHANHAAAQFPPGSLGMKSPAYQRTRRPEVEQLKFEHVRVGCIFSKKFNLAASCRDLLIWRAFPDKPTTVVISEFEG